MRLFLGNFLLSVYFIFKKQKSFQLEQNFAGINVCLMLLPFIPFHANKGQK